MSIPYWREVEYTDDGCSEFQCLNCYETWESRTTPKKWKLCPICGCHWIGQQQKCNREKYWRNDNTKRLNVCKFKIVEVYRDSSVDPIYENRTEHFNSGLDYTQAVRMLKDFRERQEEFDSENPIFKDNYISLSYHVEKIIKNT